ncbi:hypothetical protein ACQPZ2_35885 [Nocardia pseudovaccinii]|uniref:hypothetical protein n=1 Tax=Nocardia pseudovaccinii TaxID=189540 RepID=UPI003D8F2619
MASESFESEVADPRARWRHLPKEPDRYVEETQVEPTYSSYTLPAVDPTQDFIRLYGG